MLLWIRPGMDIESTRRTLNSRNQLLMDIAKEFVINHTHHVLDEPLHEADKIVNASHFRRLL